jgi:hypothetical protein
MAEKAKILYAADVRETDTFTDPSVEVIGIANHEHVVDDLRDTKRWQDDELRGLVKLAGGYPGQSLLSVITKLIEEVEHWRELQKGAPLVSGDLAQWIREELVHLHAVVEIGKHQPDVDGRILAFEAVLRRMEQEEAP